MPKCIQIFVNSLGRLVSCRVILGHVSERDECINISCMNFLHIYIANVREGFAERTKCEVSITLPNN